MYQYKLKRQTPDNRDFLSNISSKNIDLPSKYDLRDKCPVVFDQLSLSSCTANVGAAAMMMIESIHKKLNINSVPVLSRLFLYYQERKLEGNINEDCGATMRSICKALSKDGICEDIYMPYIVDEFTDAPTEEAINNASAHIISSYKALYNLSDIKKYLVSENSPVMIGIDVYESFESDKVKSGNDAGKVPIPDLKREKKLGGHAVLIVGYDDSFIVPSNERGLIGFINKFFKKKVRGALIVRNSWGEDWGDCGYFYLPYDYINKKLAFDFWTIDI